MKRKNFKNQTVKIKVTPVRGGMRAPYQIIELSKREKNKEGKAAEIVRSNCRLGQLSGWNFLSETLN